MKSQLFPFSILLMMTLTSCGPSSTNTTKNTFPTSVTTSGEEESTSTTKEESTTSDRETTSSTIEECNHEYGDWTIVNEPTLTEPGKAKRVCLHCEKEEIVTIPCLSDTSVWTKNEIDEPSCSYEGMDQYVSIYGTVIVNLPKTNHKAGDRFYLKDDLVKFYTIQTKCAVCGEFYGQQYKLTKPVEATLMPLETNYTFEYNSDFRAYVNTNKDVDNSIAIMTYRMAVSGIFSFNYSISSEINGDKLYVTKNGNGVTGLYAISGIQSSEDEPISIEVEYGDEISFRYEKDAVGNGGTDDIVKISNVSISSNDSIHLSTITFCSNGGTPVEPSITVNGKTFFDVEEPTKEGYYFAGWFEDEDCIIPLNNSNRLLDNAIVYAKWIDIDDASQFMGHYEGFSFSQYDEQDHGNLSLSGAVSLYVDFNGNTTGLLETELSQYDESTGFITNNVAHIEYLKDLDALLIYEDETLGLNTEVSVLFKGASEMSKSTLSGFFWQDGNLKTISFPETNGYKSLTLDLNRNKLMWNTYCTDLNNAIISIGSLNSIIGFNLLTQKGNSLGYFANKDGKIVGEDDCDGYQGKYQNGDNYILVSGTGSMSEYEASLGKSVNYKYTDKGEGKIANDNVTTPYLYILNKDTHTYSREVPQTQIHLNMMGVIEDVDLDVVAGSWIDLPTPDSKNWAFDGWYTEASYINKLNSRYKVPGEVTLYAKWVVKHAVTLHRNNGEGNYVIMVKDNTTPSFPTFTYEGHQFMGWFVDPELNEPFGENELVTGEMDLYAKWIVEPKFYGTFRGVWISSSYGLITDGSLNSATDGYTEITLTKDGKYTNSDTSTTYYNGKFDPSNLPDEQGHLELDNSTVVTTTITSRNNNTYLLGGFTCFGEDFVPNGVRLFTKTSSDYSLDFVSSANDYVFVSVNVNGTNDLLYLNSEDNIFIADPIIKDEDDNVISLSNISSSKVVFVYMDDGVTLVDTLVLDGNTFSPSDLFRGTYNANLYGHDYVVHLDGVGGLTLLGETTYYGSYTSSSDASLKLSFDNKKCVVDIVENILVQRLDGYEGTYTGSKGDLVLTGWGEGTLNGESLTYSIDGNYITIVLSNGEVTYGIDVKAKTYDAGAEISIFSGMTFKGTHKDSYGDDELIHFVFNNGGGIKGTIIFGYENGPFKATFTGEYDEGTHILVITFTSDIYNNGLIGKTVTFSVETGKLTVIASDGPSWTYKVQVGTVVTCSEFVL